MPSSLHIYKPDIIEQNYTPMAMVNLSAFSEVALDWFTAGHNSIRVADWLIDRAAVSQWLSLIG